MGSSGSLEGNMRKQIVLFLTLILALAAAALAADEEGKIYGDGVKLAEAVSINILIEKPEDFVGRTVRIDGIITGVCKKRGCWMKISDPESGNGIRIKVDDGVIVFPYSAMGRKASAEGVFEAIHIDGAPPKHEDKKGDGRVDCLAGAHKKGKIVYQIRGTGAVIHAS